MKGASKTITMIIGIAFTMTMLVYPFVYYKNYNGGAKKVYDLNVKYANENGVDTTINLSCEVEKRIIYLK